MIISGGGIALSLKLSNIQVQFMKFKRSGKNVGKTLRNGGVPQLNTNQRYWEYYGLQQTFDTLYAESKEGKIFNRLYELVIAESNILLAYRTIKSNKGSKTAGIDKETIDKFKDMNKNDFVEHIRNTLKDYKPKAVRRVYIPKENGDVRPLGIPTIEDRTIQQMIKQIIEPICEAKFFKHSYGFRPHRSAHHAISRCVYIINHSQTQYAVDIDIKGFFDNVNHTLLLKQLWNLGIRDRIILKIISKMLKAPIKGVGIPKKGTPQGGILSPLLANVVLHDLDMWVAKQWEEFEPRKKHYDNSHKFKTLREKSNLKIGYLIRYADDFKILTNSYKSAKKWFIAVEQYLKQRLKLDISKEKSKIINLKKNKSEFLGFSIGTFPKRNKRLASTNLCKKKSDSIKKNIRQHCKKISKEPIGLNVMRYNAYILGIHNYFKIGSHIYMDFARIGYDVRINMRNRLRHYGKLEVPSKPTPVYKKFFEGKFKTWKIDGAYLYPVADLKTTIPINFNQKVTPYTAEGRELTHKNLNKNVSGEIKKLLNTNDLSSTTEYLDNRLSRYSMKNGKCEVTQNFLTSDEVHCHHVIPKANGGSDEFKNLINVHKFVHILIHATNQETISKYLDLIKPNLKQLTKINQYRLKCNLTEIELA